MPDNTHQINSLYAQALSAAGSQDFISALNFLDRVIALNPNHVEAYYKRGNALKHLGQMEAAIASYDGAIARRPSFAYALCNRGVVQQALGQNSEALASYNLAISHDPSDAISHYNRALLLQELSQWKEAIASYDGAISIDPSYVDAHYNRALALLYCGQLKLGWCSYEWRWKAADRLGIGELQKFKQPLWLGEQCLYGKRLLLHSEGGLGDTLQFSRYVPLAADCGAIVYLEVQAPLRELLSKLEGVSAVIAKGETLPTFDYHCPLMSLPLAFNTTLQSIPPPARPLLSGTSYARRLISKATRVGPQIGLVWSGNPGNPSDPRRSVRLADLVAHLPSEYQYFRLQKDVREEDEVALRSSRIINSHDKDLLNFLSTAELCRRMDLVISVDTSIAHLSASLGKPTWLLLAFIPDWRWLQHRADSPWYPTMKLIRQESPGRWEGVFRRVASDLRREYPVDRGYR